MLAWDAAIWSLLSFALTPYKAAKVTCSSFILARFVPPISGQTNFSLILECSWSWWLGGRDFGFKIPIIVVQLGGFGGSAFDA